MTLDYLPPQAYTKETLLKAYNWLQSQSDQVKELATTPDHLVSLYLKSVRLGQDPVSRNHQVHQHTMQSEIADRPSVQSFKSELKNLAGLMGDLEKPPVSTPQAPPMAAPASAPATGQIMNQTPQFQSPNNQTSTNAYVSVAPVYDEMTQNLIREVKSELNLSSDTEALRMLVKIGYQKVRSLYK